MLALCSLPTNAGAGIEPRQSPVDGWPTAFPPAASVGLKQSALDTHARLARDRDSTCFAVLRRESSRARGTGASSATAPREVFSITKSVLSALVGIAIRDGDLRLDDRVSTLRAAVARHRVGGGDDPQPVVQRFRPFLVAESDYSDLFKAPTAPTYALGILQQYRLGTRLVLQQRGDPGPRAGPGAGNGHAGAPFARIRLFGR